MVFPTTPFPSFTICTMLFPLLPIMVFVEVVFGRGFGEYGQFFDLFFMGCCCQVVFCIIVQLKWNLPMEISRKFIYLKGFMFALLLVLAAQSSAIVYVLFYEPDKDKNDFENRVLTGKSPTFD